MEKMVRLVYLSMARRPFSRGELETLCAKSAARNRLVDVTGILLYSAGAFVQCIEGESVAIATLYARIGADTRHGGVTQVAFESLGKRIFGHWWMGLLNLDEAAPPLQKKQVATMVRAARDGSKVDAVKFLKAFRDTLPAADRRARA